MKSPPNPMIVARYIGFGIIYVLLVGGLYGFAIHHPWREATLIHATRLDKAWPFRPAWAWVYATYFFLLPALVLWRGGKPGFALVLATGISDNLINIAVNLAYPTRIENRMAAPPGSLLALIQKMDTLLAALPSGHVSLPASLAFGAFLAMRTAGRDRRSAWMETGWVYSAWTLLLAFATLFTKQHYLWDVLAGLGLGAGVAISTPKLVTVVQTVNARSVTALAGEYAAMAAAMAIALHWRTWPAYALAGAFIATRQHAVLVLYHDAVHGQIARSKRLNDFIINACVGVPMLLPIHLYRALHMSHHRDLGTPHDPERVLLYRNQPWDFRALPTAGLIAQFIGDFSGYFGIKMAADYFKELRAGTRLRLPKAIWYPELAVQYAFFGLALLLSAFAFPKPTAIGLALWYLPYITLTQGLQKIRSFAEHTTEAGHPSLTCSWRPGLLGRATIWPYNIHLHRTHHAHSQIPWHDLPRHADATAHRAGSELFAHLWRRS